MKLVQGRSTLEVELFVPTASGFPPLLKKQNTRKLVIQLNEEVEDDAPLVRKARKKPINTVDSKGKKPFILVDLSNLSSSDSDSETDCYEIIDKRQAKTVFAEATMGCAKARAKHVYQQQHYIPPPSIIKKLPVFDIPYPKTSLASASKICFESSSHAQSMETDSKQIQTHPEPGTVYDQSGSYNLVTVSDPSSSKQPPSQTINFLNFTINLYEPLPATHLELEEFRTLMYTKVQSIIDERSNTANFEEHTTKWDAYREEIDEALQKMKESARLCAEANKEALKACFVEISSQIDLAYLRSNPQRQIARKNTAEIPNVNQYPPVNPATPLVPLRPQHLILSAGALQSHYVSAAEFKTFKEEIRTELAAQRAKQDAIYENLAAQSAKQEAMDNKLDILIKLCTNDLRKT